MKEAARAIIIKDGKILLMHRNKYGSQYYTLVGGRIDTNETPEQALVREVKEETGLNVVAGSLVFIEDHPAPYNKQLIYVCNIAPHGEVAIQHNSEEAYMNKFDMNVHTPVWVNIKSFGNVQFRTPQLQAAILEALKKGFPVKPVNL